MRNSKFILTALAAMVMQGAYAQQPYGGCWHPEDIKNWSPETDPDAKFNAHVCLLLPASRSLRS